MANIDRLLATNQVPSTNEVVEVERDMVRLDVDLESLELEITRARAMLERLERKRRRIRTKRQAYEFILSPVRRLPLEILGDIFAFGLPVHLGRATTSVLQSYMGVCRTWRHACLSSPKIWADLSITCDHTSKIENYMPHIGKWAQRSGSLPLKLSLEAPTYSSEGISEFLSELPAKNRWKDISLNISQSSCLAPLFHASLAQGWPMLESLSIVAWDIGEKPLTRNGSFGLTDAPHLERLSLRILEHLNRGALHMPWSQLVELTLMSNTTIVEYLEILKECPRLQSCSISLEWDDNSTNESSLPMTFSLPFLYYLSVKRVSSSLSPFFKPISLPSLTELIIEADSHESPEELPLTEIVAIFLTRSGCSLEKFELSTSNLEDAQLTSLLQTSPTLVEVKIRASTLDGSFLVPLTSLEVGVGIPLPRLEVIELHNCKLEFSRQAFASFLRTRLRSTWNGVSMPIASLRRAVLAYQAQNTPTSIIETLRVQNEGFFVALPPL